MKCTILFLKKNVFALCMYVCECVFFYNRKNVVNLVLICIVRRGNVLNNREKVSTIEFLSINWLEV